MLTSGMVPALFADEEKEAIQGQVKLFVTLIESKNLKNYS
jgi:hypothetical protein